jgi:preprotein translocase subunit SecY
MVYFINQILGGTIIDTSNITVLLLSAFVLAVGSVILMWIGELITEYGLTNGISLLIFASIVSGISSSLGSSVATSASPWQFIIFVLVIVVVLIVLSVLLIKTIKEIPIIYAKQGKVQQTSMLPFPLNPVGMVPIIFAIAFTSFPYLASQLIIKIGSDTIWVMQAAEWVNANFNIYVQNPSWYVTVFYFLLIIFFTFFYAIIQFNPEKIADNVQKRGGFIPSIRPGIETVNYINKVLMHLCLWGGIGLGLLGIYSYLMNYIPFIQQLVQSLGSVPVIVTGSGIVIVV